MAALIWWNARQYTVLLEKTKGKDFIITPLAARVSFTHVDDDAKRCQNRCRRSKREKSGIRGCRPAGTQEPLRWPNTPNRIGAGWRSGVFPSIMFLKKTVCTITIKALAESRQIGIMIYNNPDVFRLLD